MTRHKIFFPAFIFSCLHVLTACVVNIKPSYELPEGVKLRKGEAVFQALFVAELVGNPNKSGSIWSSTLLKKCEMKQLSIIHYDAENEKKATEEAVYFINKNGAITQYKYYQYNQSPKPISKSKFFNSKQGQLDSIYVQRYLDIATKNTLTTVREKDRTEYFYKKGGNKTESIVHFYHKGELEMIVQKIESTITQIDFIVQEHTPLSKLKKMGLKISNDPSLFELCDKNVVYMRDNRPVSSYSLNANWAQLDLNKSWEYDDDLKLKTYKEYVNRVNVKEISLDYLENNLPRSFVYNKVVYYFDFK
jgi:hypothetical protein